MNLKISRNIIKLLILLLIGVTPISCNVTLKIKDGNEAYDLKKYSIAAELLQDDYEKAKEKKEKFAIAKKIAASYLAFSEFEKAEIWLKKSVDLDIEPQSLFDYAMVLKQNEKYSEAIDNLNTYYQYDRSQRILVTGHIDACKEILEAKKNDIYTSIVNLKDINTSFSEFGTLIEDGEILFSSNRVKSDIQLDDWTGKGYADIYSALILKDTMLETAELWRPDINSTFHEAILAFNNEKTEIYFTRCGFEDDNKDVCKIFKTFKEFDEWSNPEQIILFDDSSNVGHPYITSDGKQLYFSSDYAFGYGGKDIYVSTRIGEEWESPINLGPRINTVDDEMFPLISNDGKLYFASSGHFGYGGLDLFCAEKRGRIFTNVQTLGYPINTGADDFAAFLIANPDDSVEITGYLSSNRKGGVGSDDIYFFEKRLTPEPKLPPAVFILKGIVEEKIFANPQDPKSAVTGKQPLSDALIKIYDNTDINIPYLIESLTSTKQGAFETILDEDVEYSLDYNKTGYFSNNDIVSTKNYSAKNGDTIIINKRITLEKIYKEVEFVLNIYYDLDSANIRPDAAIVLDSLANILVVNPSLQVELASHTDSRGSDPYNLDLSQRRADSAVLYLISKGIVADRLIAKGYGETRLVNECDDGISCTDQQHQANRRTTFKVVGINYQLK